MSYLCGNLITNIMAINIFNEHRLKTGIKLRVIEDSYCQEYINEVVNHYRKDLIEKKLIKWDEVEFISITQNCYRNFIKVFKDGIKYDIKPSNLEIIKAII